MKLCVSKVVIFHSFTSFEDYMMTRPFKSEVLGATGFFPHTSFFLNFCQGLQALLHQLGDYLISPSRRSL